VQRRLLDLSPAAGIAKRRELVFIASAMSQITCRWSLYLGVSMSRNSPITWEQQVPKRTGLRDFDWAMRQILA
jgi:hypothetical protein